MVIDVLCLTAYDEMQSILVSECEEHNIMTKSYPACVEIWELVLRLLFCKQFTSRACGVKILVIVQMVNYCQVATVFIQYLLLCTTNSLQFSKMYYYKAV